MGLDTKMPDGQITGAGCYARRQSPAKPIASLNAMMGIAFAPPILHATEQQPSVGLARRLLARRGPETGSGGARPLSSATADYATPILTGSSGRACSPTQELSIW